MAGRKSGIHVGLGVEPGIPDVIVFKKISLHAPGGPTFTHVFALELKRESRRKRRRTEHESRQLETRTRMHECGVTTGIAYGLNEAIAWLEDHHLLLGRAT
jgi:hypothetical protein